ncbi:hypothetical protein [Tepidicella baoligensis]|uniref:hypothetical protein n=1 Tax=Tepidicella baoligensis TaxID=2707016 RepID=UPI001FEBD0CE|nr:hypothetical protein [Tepidicella baoligensis]
MTARRTKFGIGFVGCPACWATFTEFCPAGLAPFGAYSILGLAGLADYCHISPYLSKTSASDNRSISISIGFVDETRAARPMLKV